MNARALASEQQLRMANLRRGGGGGGGSTAHNQLGLPGMPQAQAQQAQLQQQQQQAALRAEFDRADRNADGVLSYEEFAAMHYTTPQPPPQAQQQQLQQQPSGMQQQAVQCRQQRRAHRLVPRQRLSMTGPWKCMPLPAMPPNAASISYPYVIRLPYIPTPRHIWPS